MFAPARWHRRMVVSVATAMVVVAVMMLLLVYNVHEFENYSLTVAKDDEHRNFRELQNICDCELQSSISLHHCVARFVHILMCMKISIYLSISR